MCRHASVYATDANTVCKSGVEADALAVSLPTTFVNVAAGSHFESMFFQERK